MSGRVLMQRDVEFGRGVAGMKSALVDMWVLSRTQKVMSSFRTTFSEVAAQMSGAELCVVNVDAPK